MKRERDKMTAIRFAVLMAFAMVPALLPCMAFAEEDYSGAVYEDQAWYQDVTDPEYIEYIRNMTDLEYIEYMRNVTEPEYIEYIRNMPDPEYFEYLQNLTDPMDIDNPVITEEGEVSACSEEMLNADETDEINDLSESGEAEIEVSEDVTETDDPAEAEDPEVTTEAEDLLVAAGADDPADTEELSETEAIEDAEGDGIQPDIEEPAEAEEIEDPEFVTETDDPEVTTEAEDLLVAAGVEDPEAAGESWETMGSEGTPEADIVEEDMSEIEGAIDLANTEESAEPYETGESDQENPLTLSVIMDPAESVAVESTEKAPRTEPARTEPAPTVLAEEPGSEPSAPAETVPEVSGPIILEIPGLLMEADNFSDLTAGLANLVRERRAARGSWALIDLVAMFFTSLISLLMIGLLIISSQADKYDEKKGDTDNSLFITLLSLIPAASQIIIFSLTQDLSQQMLLSDRYTGPVLLFLAAEVFIAGIICWKVKAADQKRMSY